MCVINAAMLKASSIIQDDVLRLQVLEIWRNELSPYQGDRITTHIRKDRTKDHKRMIELHTQGMSNRAIAKIMQCAPRTVRKVVTF